MDTLTQWLVVIGTAVVSLGTIHEADGIKEHSFWLRNEGNDSVRLVQGYTSCGCTTIGFDKNAVVAPGDSTSVVLTFNPQGKGGDFEETGTLVYRVSDKTQRIALSLTGNCITSEETLLRQFPIRINDDLRMSANHYDLGIMHKGETKQRGIVVLHRDEGNRQEYIPVTFSVGKDMETGIHHVSQTLKVRSLKQEVTTTIIYDVLVK
ncbi:MAG: DUF1573 domain-containing protein [Prevotella sp.]|nr:DUF1573 domain-containing protein [Prevotella sp.]